MRLMKIAILLSSSDRDQSSRFFMSHKGNFFEKVENDRKYAVFKNWLDTRLKMETHEPNVYLIILGGVSRGFWSPFLDLGAQSPIFWHLKMGTFGHAPKFANAH